MQGSYLGPKYSQEEIEKVLNKLGAKFHVLDEEKIKKKDKEYYIGIGLCFGVAMQKLKKSQK